MDVISETAGIVSNVTVAVGDNVAEGSVLIVTELMKMLAEYKAPQNGVVSEILVAAGDEVQVGQRLAVVTEAAVTGGPIVAKTDAGYTDALIDELLERRQG